MRKTRGLKDILSSLIMKWSTSLVVFVLVNMLIAVFIVVGIWASWFIVGIR